MFYRPLFNALLHGTYIDDVFWGVIFVIMLGVFLYFYFSDKGEAESEDDNHDSHQ